MKISDLISKGLEYLGKGKFLETLLILEKASGLKKEAILSSYEKEILPDIEKRFLNLILKREKGFPLQYIIGKTEFWSLEFKVREGVFIPRPETELIVEKIIEFAKGKSLLIADIGTGCGNIAIALAKELVESKIYATDISLRAIELAEENAKINGVYERIKFLRGNLFESLNDLKKSFDIICSNPPYIPKGDRKNLQKEVAEFEPKRAIFSGMDGLNFLRRFVKDAPLYLKEKGRVYIEFGDGMAEKVSSLFSGWSMVKVYKDLHQKPRVLMAQL